MLAEKYRAVILIYMTFAEKHSKIGSLYILTPGDFYERVMNKYSK